MWALSIFAVITVCKRNWPEVEPKRPGRLDPPGFAQNNPPCHVYRRLQDHYAIENAW